MPSSVRSRRIAALRERRQAKVAFREAILEFFMAGHSHDMIARMKKISVSTVRREIARALDARPVEAPERFIALQMARMSKTMQAIDEAIEDGDLGAINPFLKVMAGLDRYHGLATRLASSAAVPETIPAPPLALPAAEPKPGHEMTHSPLKSAEA